MKRSSRVHAFTQSASVDNETLRDRVRLYLKVLFFIDLCFHVLGPIIEALPLQQPVEFVDDQVTIRALSFAITILLGAGWAYVAKFQPSRKILIALESLGTLLLSFLYTRFATLIPDEGAPFVFLLVSLALVLRAALVPSPLARTIVVGSLAMIAASTTIILAGTRANLVLQIWLAIMGAAFVAVTGIISFVIYGLQKEVRAAQRLGQYELKRKIGEGGMGAVYEATHLMLKRPTAVKLLPIEKVGEQTVLRFEREVQQTSRLEHHNSIYIYDYGRTPNGQFYYAMEYLDGLNLEQLIEQYGPANDGRTCHILRQASHALAEAHAMGLVHRDLKPANIMLCDMGQIPDTVKVLDFGLVKAPDTENDAQVTQENSVLGTPAYMAPETITMGVHSAGPPADVYALGAIGYFMLTGEPVFTASSVFEIMARHLKDEPTPLADAAGRPVSPDLASIIHRCLAKEPEERFQDAEELAEALEGLDTPEWNSERAREWWTTYKDKNKPPSAPGGEGMTELAVDVAERLG